MPDDRPDYKDLLAAFGENKLQDRVSYLLELASSFLECFEITDFVSVNNRLIYECITDYFADIQRLKKFHQVEKIEPCKVAAYTAYWVWKRRPLQLKPNLAMEAFDQEPMLVSVNEHFACFLFITMVFDLRKRNWQSSEGLKAWNDFHENLNYFFTYRVVTPQALQLALLGVTSNPPFERLPFLETHTTDGDPETRPDPLGRNTPA